MRAGTQDSSVEVEGTSISKHGSFSSVLCSAWAKWALRVGRWLAGATYGGTSFSEAPATASSRGRRYFTTAKREALVELLLVIENSGGGAGEWRRGMVLLYLPPYCKT